MEHKNELLERDSRRTKKMWCYKSPGKIFIKCHGEIKEEKDFVVKKKKKVTL